MVMQHKNNALLVIQNVKHVMVVKIIIAKAAT